MKLTKKCPVCNKVSEIKSESRLNDLTITHYTCGHVRAKRAPTIKDLENFESIDGKKPFKYQLEGAAWAIKNNARVLFADETGVGKTVQSFLVCKSDPSEYLPVLIICKAALKTQFEKEADRWCDWMSQTLENESDFVLKGLPCYIVGYDSLAYFEFKNKKGKLITRGIKDLDSWIEKIQPRTIILDECQSVKNSEAKRTQAIQKLARFPEHLIALSGTPILNHAGEYFPILNMLQPEKFPNKNAFIMRWCDSYYNFSSNSQKIGGIKDVQGFKRFTEDFIIRRTRKEVLPDLPETDRRFRFEELGEKVEEAYKAEFKKFQDYYYYGGNGDSSFTKDGNILAYLNKMRHLTGIAKIPGVVEFTEEFLENTDRKLVIFTHHLDIARETYERISERRKDIIYAPAPIDPKLIDDFWKDEYRVILLSTIAGGEGLNLQCCSDYIQMEPEWSPLKELQASGRFPRPGQKSDKITGTEFIAVGTVDEFFSELKEQKRVYFASTIEGVEGLKWNESSLIKELAEILAQKGGKKWNL